MNYLDFTFLGRGGAVAQRGLFTANFDFFSFKKAEFMVEFMLL